MGNIATFDIFDTTITRAVGLPVSVFLLLGRQLALQEKLPCSAEVFARAREDAEFRARANFQNTEITLQQIYKELSLALGFDDTLANLIMECELSLEEKLIYPVPIIKKYLEEARKNDKRIVFLSDMYLPQEWINKLLLKKNLFQTGNGCYVSSQYGKLKSTGDLFRVVANDFRTTVANISHLGNHQLLDVNAAIQAGCGANLLNDANLNRYEKILEKYRWDTDGLTSVMAGSARLARLNILADDTNSIALRDVSASVAGPILSAYVLWIFREAKRLGLKRLYFVARDGYILLEIAKRLAKNMNINLELRYLYGGRQAWHLPSINNIEEVDNSWLCERFDFLSVKRMLARISITPEQIETELLDFGINNSEWDTDLDKNTANKLAKFLKSNIKTREIIYTVAKAKRNLIIKYFKQEGLLDNIDFGYVDLGWRGRLQVSLNRIIESAGGKPPHGFYFGLFERSNQIHEDYYHAYLFDNDIYKGITTKGRIGSIGICLEMFCQAPHGMTQGYKKYGEIIVPELKNPHNLPAQKWGLEIVHDTVKQYAEILSDNLNFINPNLDCRQALVELFNEFWTLPALEESIAWGSYPCEDDQLGDRHISLASEFTWTDIFMFFRHLTNLFCTSIFFHKQVLWYEGSLKQTKYMQKLSIKILYKIQKFKFKLVKIRTLLRA